MGAGAPSLVALAPSDKRTALGRRSVVLGRSGPALSSDKAGWTVCLMAPPLDTREVPECVSCGTCCFSDNPRYLSVAGVDYERLGEDAERLTVFFENRAFMRLLEGHCAALSYDVPTARYLCSIYERRPDVCRWLERGSGQCAAERHEKAQRPILLRLRAEGG